MKKKRMSAVFVALLMWALASQVSAQVAEPKFNSNADDLAKIRDVLEEYRQDIIRKDGYAITKLVLNHNVLFHHINTQEEIDSARKRNAQFDGIGPSHLDELVEIFATSKDKLEGKLQNIEIRQDGPLGMVTFNYDFYVNDKLTNSGLEHWQLCKIDGQWKIFSLPGRAMFAADRQRRSREQGELMPGDCSGPLRKEKRMVISAPSARGGNCIPLSCGLFRPSSELYQNRRIEND